MNITERAFRKFAGLVPDGVKERLRTLRNKIMGDQE